MTGRKVGEKIVSALQESLSPEKLQVVNVSANHHGHAGDDGSGESHFEVFIVAGQFAKCNRIERHRMIFSILQEALESMPHALSIKALAPAEQDPHTSG